MLADSTINCLAFSVRRLSSEPARSMAEAMHVLTCSPEVMVKVRRNIACEREEDAFS